MIDDFNRLTGQLLHDKIWNCKNLDFLEQISRVLMDLLYSMNTFEGVSFKTNDEDGFQYETSSMKAVDAITETYSEYFDFDTASQQANLMSSLYTHKLPDNQSQMGYCIIERALYMSDMTKIMFSAYNVIQSKGIDDYIKNLYKSTDVGYNGIVSVFNDVYSLFEVTVQNQMKGCKTYVFKKYLYILKQCSVLQYKRNLTQLFKMYSDNVAACQPDAHTIDSLRRIFMLALFYTEECNHFINESTLVDYDIPLGCESFRLYKLITTAFPYSLSNSMEKILFEPFLKASLERNGNLVTENIRDWLSFYEIDKELQQEILEQTMDYALK
jgi:hypothetical protein